MSWQKSRTESSFCLLYTSDRAVQFVVRALVRQVELLRQVVVHLNGSQLPLAADGVLDHEVELRAVEGRDVYKRQGRAGTVGAPKPSVLILGNGPSLAEDLPRLIARGEHTAKDVMAVNYFCLLYTS